MGDGALIDAAVRAARFCANAPLGVVFCPPIASFKTGSGATDNNLACGLTLSVECDENPAAARAVLEGLLGPATVVVASGGQWIDPETGEVESKLHCHWRLAAPARSPEEHAALKQARRRAMRFIGGDATGVPICHPYRWPGSWHRKTYDRPVLARIVALHDVEIDLEVALAGLPEDEEREFVDTEVVGQLGVTEMLSDYGRAALISAAGKILGAPNGKQEHTLNGQSYSIGTAAGAGIVPVALALDVLLEAARGLTNYDPGRPWREGQAEKKVRHAFAAGMARPRPDWADVERELDRMMAEAADV